VARDAGVGTLELNHHDAFQDDDAVHLKESAARAEFAGALCAREGLTLAV
jgi:ribonuclease BN (tRNA processing enzyme)